jgi:hypothetical protein
MKKEILSIVLIFGLLVAVPFASAGVFDWLFPNNVDGDQPDPQDEGQDSMGNDFEVESEFAEKPSSSGGSGGGGPAPHIPADAIAIADLPGKSVSGDYLVLKSPDGNYWKISVDNGGELATTLLDI